MNHLLAATFAVAALLGLPATAAAHTMGNGYLDLTVDGSAATGELDLAVRDLHDAVGLDPNHDGQVRWREILDRLPELRRYVLDHLTISAGVAGAAPCIITFGTAGIVSRADGEHLALPLTARCDRELTALTLDYRAIFEVDAQHRGLVRIARKGATGTEALRLIAHPGAITVELQQASGDFLGFIKQGIWHIWIGVDHLCFLIALLLPAVLRRVPGRWEPAPRFADVLRDVLDVVPAFTLAHSITLVVSAMGWMRLPVRFVETAIALSVAVAALNNLVRAIDARWAVAFALGLLHGFGFSNVLLDVGLPGHHLVAALLGFNVGVEAGQLAIVAAFLPVAFLVRRTGAYRFAMWAASGAMCIVAVRWSIERALS
jgi:hypothetical protein